LLQKLPLVLQNLKLPGFMTGMQDYLKVLSFYLFVTHKFKDSEIFAFREDKVDRFACSY